MIAIIKELYVFALLLLVFSYLVPKEEYKSYIQFFIGIFLLVVVLKPVLKLVMTSDAAAIYEVFDGFNERMDDLEGVNQWKEEGAEDIYELFIFKGEGE